MRIHRRTAIAGLIATGLAPRAIATVRAAATTAATTAANTAATTAATTAVTAAAPTAATTGVTRPLPQPAPALWDPRPARPPTESFAQGPNGKVCVRTYGDVGRTPVIVLHGGPAAGHRYMRPYAALAAGRQMAFYDQSGCGRSAAPADLSRYTTARYVEELEAVRAHLGWQRVVLLGHSWGGMLAPMYAAAHPERVTAMVLAGTAPAWADFGRAAQRWLAALGPQALATAKAGPGAAGYDALIEAYYSRHLCRLAPPPDWFNAEGETLSKNPVYLHLNGPTEFDFSGAFKTIDLSALLPGVAVPTLVTCGEFDEAPPWVGRKLVALLPKARLHSFDGLSHMAHVEDPQRVMAVTGKFLRSVG